MSADVSLKDLDHTPPYCHDMLVQGPMWLRLRGKAPPLPHLRWS